MDKTIYEQLDGLLKFHLGNDYYEINALDANTTDQFEHQKIWQIRDERIKELELTDKKDLIEALYRKLEKDGHIEKRETIRKIKLTADGLVFIKTGGYEEKEKKLNSEKNRIYYLENRGFYVSLTLAVGTSIAAWYYLTELCKYYHWCFCH